MLCADKMTLKKRGPGRPPSGPKGQKVSEYRHLTIRLPPDTRNKLAAWAALTSTPIWKLIDEAVTNQLSVLPAAKRKLIEDASSGD